MGDPAEHSGEFVWRMEDVLEAYQRPYDPRRPLVCMDETSKQLLRDVTEGIPAKPGKVERVDYEYEREGVVNLFLFSEPLAGKRWFDLTDHRTKADWAGQIKDLVEVRYPEAERIVLVMDNLNVHTPGALYEVYSPEEARRLLESWRSTTRPSTEAGSTSRRSSSRSSGGSALAEGCRTTRPSQLR